LVAGAALLGDWRGALFAIATACAVAACCIMTIIVIDRPVFRVLFPMAYVLFIFAVLVFPWHRLGGYHGLPYWRRRALLSTIAAFCVMGGIGILAGMA